MRVSLRSDVKQPREHRLPCTRRTPYRSRRAMRHSPPRPFRALEQITVTTPCSKVRKDAERRSRDTPPQVKLRLIGSRSLSLGYAAVADAAIHDLPGLEMSKLAHATDTCVLLGTRNRLDQTI